MKRKVQRVVSSLYLCTHRNPKTGRYESDEEGYLFSKGLYRTKIRAEDLPAWYAKGIIYNQEGYISTKGVKYLLLKSDSKLGRFGKEDRLFISYDSPIEPDEEGINGIWFHGYDHVITGEMIGTFLRNVRRYSDIAIDEVLNEYKNKSR